MLNGLKQGADRWSRRPSSQHADRRFLSRSHLEIGLAYLPATCCSTGSATSIRRLARHHAVESAARLELGPDPAVRPRIHPLAVSRPVLADALVRNPASALAELADGPDQRRRIGAGAGAPDSARVRFDITLASTRDLLLLMPFSALASAFVALGLCRFRGRIGLPRSSAVCPGRAALLGRRHDRHHGGDAIPAHPVHAAASPHCHGKCLRRWR